MLTNRAASLQDHLRSHPDRDAGVVFLPRSDDNRVHRPSTLVHGSVVGTSTVASRSTHLEDTGQRAQTGRVKEEVISHGTGARTAVS